MFDSKKTSLPGRLADAVDLLIDFATLGEYGLEPTVGNASRCESRHRSGPPRAGSRRSADERALASRR